MRLDVLGRSPCLEFNALDFPDLSLTSLVTLGKLPYFSGLSVYSAVKWRW